MTLIVNARDQTPVYCDSTVGSFIFLLISNALTKISACNFEDGRLPRASVLQLYLLQISAEWDNLKSIL